MTKFQYPYYHAQNVLIDIDMLTICDGTFYMSARKNRNRSVHFVIQNLRGLIRYVVTCNNHVEINCVDDTYGDEE